MPVNFVNNAEKQQRIDYETAVVRVFLLMKRTSFQERQLSAWLLDIIATVSFTLLVAVLTNCMFTPNNYRQNEHLVQMLVRDTHFHKVFFVTLVCHLHLRYADTSCRRILALGNA